MYYFYSGYIVNKNTGQNLATSHGILKIEDGQDLIGRVTSEMIGYYNGPFPTDMINVHIIALNKVG